jgi:mitochondrial import receptor subunit TOM20
MAKEARESEGKQQQDAIKRAVEEAQEEGFPSDIEEREAFFMKEVAEGEARNGEGTDCKAVTHYLSDSSIGSDPIGAALCFYKALKVYPEPKTLINIYDNTVSKDVLEILAVMCSQDKELNHKIGGSASGSESGHGVE